MSMNNSRLMSRRKHEYTFWICFLYDRTPDFICSYDKHSKFWWCTVRAHDLMNYLPLPSSNQSNLNLNYYKKYHIWLRTRVLVTAMPLPINITTLLSHISYFTVCAFFYDRYAVNKEHSDVGVAGRTTKTFPGVPTVLGMFEFLFFPKRDVGPPSTAWPPWIVDVGDSKPDVGEFRERSANVATPPRWRGFQRVGGLAKMQLSDIISANTSNTNLFCFRLPRTFVTLFLSPQVTLSESSSLSPLSSLCSCVRSVQDSEHTGDDPTNE